MLLVIMEKKEDINEIVNDNYAINCDVDFCSFYYKAVKRLFNIDNKANVSYLYRYAKIFYSYYDRFCQVKSDLENPDNAIIKLLKESFFYRLIFIYRNATLFSSAVAFHFRNAFAQETKSIQRLVKNNLVKICSIGGCSTPDIVAIITVLKSIASQNGITLDFRITVIDFNLDWKNTCITVLSGLDEFHGATWKINFVKINFVKNNTWPTEMFKAIQEADVITLVKFSSCLTIKRNILSMLCSNVKTNAILFVLDRPYTKFIELCFGIQDLGDFRLLHTELCDYHTLDIEAVKQFKTLYQKELGEEKYFESNVSLNLFVCVWIKASTELHTKHKYNLKCIFEISGEKYNPKESFLSFNALTRWENSLIKKKKSAGWKDKEIKKFVEKQRRARNNIHGRFIPLKKGVDSIQNHLLTEAQSLSDDEKEFSEANEKLLEDYLLKKRQYSLLKKTAYFSALSANNLLSIVE